MLWWILIFDPLHPAIIRRRILRRMLRMLFGQLWDASQEICNDVGEKPVYVDHGDISLLVRVLRSC